MKKAILMALVLGASASFHTADAKKKKKVDEPAKPQPVQLLSSSDSVSYTGGMAITNGLLPYLMQQGVDTAYMADFIRGFEETVNSASDPKVKAYIAGTQIADQISSRMLPGMTNEFTDSPDSIVATLFYQGFKDALLGDTTRFTQPAAEAYFQVKQEADKKAKDEKLYGPVRDAGRRFLAENAKKDSIITTPSGLQYKVLVQGEGAVPQTTDKVLVNYEGRLIDGTVFDASKRHGDKPASFLPTQVIKGWTEALTMMPVGSKWQLFIPYELAYGERSMGQIKPYSALIFDVELVGIDQPEAKADEAKPADQPKAPAKKKAKKPARRK